ncbi:armadillo-type protein [Daldinia caldariorum]|uniref:armadillo-type protein n=1 Tax=Daldinia caldariorum TaxID=326644 RepID=UPI002008BD00|nr:armadillo-type protein [Daldinia caldariorum]KAI1465801.1 armadillo-type protein [Daldinia caldariorum]
MGMEYTSIGFAIVLGIVSLGYILLLPLGKRIRRRDQEPRPDGIIIYANPQNAKFEIVAVHGLGAHPEHTWKGPGGVHLLRELLKDSFPEARILSFAYNSDWLVNAPIQSTEPISKWLLEELTKKRQSPRLPIIFMGHSFGGIVIKEALSSAQCSREILEDTCGIIFLGTPHQGSSASFTAAMLASWTSLLGSDNTLLLSLQSHGPDLSDLQDRFMRQISSCSRDVPVVYFYETRPTYIMRWFSVGLIVNRDSASGFSANNIDMDTNHTGLNKFRGLEDTLYAKLKEKIQELRAPSKFEVAYRHICENIYTKENLKIERLSGQCLPMDQCYINLAIVRDLGGTSDALVNQSFQFSLSTRLRVETPAKELQVGLHSLFDPRKQGDGSQKAQRRILIRGRAGVGKTTLCKKIVHEFIHNQMWTSEFDYIFWIPLRKLNEIKLKKLDKMFSQLYFHDRTDGSILAEALWHAIDTKKYERCLFILDGLDELSELVESHPTVLGLLRKPNVIITTRPHKQLSPSLKIDLELETIGFYPDQVQCYLEKVAEEPSDVQEIKLYIQKHQLIQSLVRIPIQLDALCQAKDRITKGPSPDTMTTIYEAITQHLWEKDIERLERESKNYVNGASETEIYERIKPEAEYLEHLAFNGMCNDVVEFRPQHRDKVRTYIALSDSKFPLNERLGRLSFLRPSRYFNTEKSKQNYHFLHLTFQEFFAAKYIVRKWKSGILECLDFQDLERSPSKISPRDFIRENKYDARFDIVWRFTAGLLRGEGLQHFFDLIEQEPRDILGPVHQRLVMHCLSETGDSTDLQSRPELEEKLRQWLLFEVDHNRFPSLHTEPEFPDRALIADLKMEGSTEQKKIILNALAYGRKVPFSTAVVAALEELITYGDEDIRDTSIEALRNQSNLSEQTIARLMLILTKGDIYKRNADHISQVIAAQSNIPGETIAKLVEIVQDEYEPVAYAAATALVNQSDLPEEFVATLVESIQNAGWKTKNAISEVLRNQRNLSRETIRTLTTMVVSRETWIHEKAIYSMARNSDLPEKTIQTLVQLLVNTPWDVQITAAEALAYQTSLSKETKRSLKELTESPDPLQQYIAAIAFKTQSILSEQTITALLTLIEYKTRTTRRYAIEALEEQSSLSENAILALIKLLPKTKDNRGDVLLIIEDHLKFSEIITPGLVQLLEDENPKAQHAAIHILKSNGSTDLPGPIIRALVTLLLSENRKILSDVTFLLRSQRDFSKETIAIISGFLDDANEYVRYEVAFLLSRQSNLLETDVPRILALLRANYETHPTDVTTAIASMLKDKEGDIRSEVDVMLQELQSLIKAQLLAGDVGTILYETYPVMSRMPKLPYDVAISFITILTNLESRYRNEFPAKIANYHPSCAEKVLDALGVSVEIKEAIGRTKIPRIPHQYIRSLYGILLRRSFVNHIWMEIKDNSILRIHSPHGTRTALLDIQCDDPVLSDWRRWWGAPEF